MSMQDPISDMLTRIRNAIMAGHKSTAMPSSKQKLAIAKVLKEEGYILDFSVDEADAVKPSLTVMVKYHSGKPVISGIQRVSRPGLRVYRSYSDIPKTWGGFGISIVSTSAGVICDREARAKKVGGEIWCEVW